MLIDWVTIGAQALNFLILVWVMNHFLYRPVLAAIDARETKIAAELADAAAKKAEATKERDEFQHKNEEFDQQRAALLSKATDEAKAERQRLLVERMAEVFTRRLRALDGPGKQTLGDALRTAADPALVRSAFDLPAEQRASIQHALNETFSAAVPLRYETTPDLVSGIELTANGQKVAWSIADYLASLESGVGELLRPEDKPVPKAESGSADPKPENQSA